MIATIIAIIIALATTVWAFIERAAKKLLNEALEGMKVNDAIVQTELSRAKATIEEEKALLAYERKKSADLAKNQCTCPEKAPEMVTKSAVISVSEMDVTGLVDVTDEFKIGEDERVVFFEFYKDKSAPKEIRWRLKAKNNKVLADSGEGYGTKQNLKKALGVMLNAIKKVELKSKWKS